MRRGALFAALVGIAASAVGCGDEATGDCPDLRGAWTVQQHCVADFIGMGVGVNQSGCEVTTSGAFNGFAGRVTAAGEFNVGGTVGSDVISCSGTATTGLITLSCDDEPPCEVALRR